MFSSDKIRWMLHFCVVDFTLVICSKNFKLFDLNPDPSNLAPRSILQISINFQEMPNKLYDIY